MPQDYQPDATQQAALAALKNVVAARDWSDQADVANNQSQSSSNHPPAEGALAAAPFGGPACH